MESTKKVEFEKRIMIGLVGVLAVTFFLGPVKTLGWFRAKPQAVKPALGNEVVHMPPSITVGVQERWKRIDSKPELVAPLKDEDAEAAPDIGGNYTAQALRDPFGSLLPQATEPSANEAKSAASPQAIKPVKPEPKAASAPAVSIQGVLWGGSQPQAIIDHQVYEIGDAIDGATITEIHREGVVFDVNGASVELKLGDGPSPAMWPRTTQGRR